MNYTSIYSTVGLYGIYWSSLSTVETDRDRDRYNLLEQNKTRHSSWRCLRILCSVVWSILIGSASVIVSSMLTQQKLNTFRKETLTHCEQLGLAFPKKENTGRTLAPKTDERTKNLSIRLLQSNRQYLSPLFGHWRNQS